MADSVFENLDVTPDEIQRLEKAMKDEKFRKMLVEYAQKLQDPENKRKYEEEIAMLEQNRGMNVTFLNPSPGYVLKTNNGEKKVFVNICKCDKVAEPKAEVTTQEQNGVKKSGVNWSMPYSLAPGREDLDKGGKTCMVYDVVFHPKCFEKSQKDRRIQNLMEATALGGIEREFNEKLDRTNMKRPKMKFKGQPQATVIRTPNDKGPSGKSDGVSDLNLPYPFDDSKPKQNQSSNAPAKSTSKISGSRNQASKPAAKTEANKTSGPAEPRYTITHRGHFDMQQFTNARDSMTSTRPQELIIQVELPLLKSAAPVQLDVFEKQILLESKKPAAYKLDLKLPYPVDEENGSAKFDKSKSCLQITLPVLPPEKVEMLSFAPEESHLVEEVANGNVAEELVESEPSQLIKEIPPSEEVKHDKENKQLNGAGADESDVERTKADETKASSKEDDEYPKQNSLDSDDDELPDRSSSVESQDVKDEQSNPKSLAVCPSYTFKQDLDTVTFVIQTPNVDPASLQKEIHTDVLCDVKVEFRTSAKNDGVEVESSDPDVNLFCLHVQFDKGCDIGEVMVEATGGGAVVIMVKVPSCRGEWSGFKAGANLEDLKEKKFLTEDNILDAVSRSDKTNGEPSVDMEIASAQATDEKLVVDFKVMKDDPNNMVDTTSSGTPAEGELTPVEDAMEPATDVIIESLIGEASNDVFKAEDIAEILKLDLNQNIASDYVTTSMSDASPPSTPNSARSLKSALRRVRRYHSSKSVSFSEDVEVEVLVSPGKTKKGKPRPLVAKRRIERLKTESQGRRKRYHSDSEVSYNPNGGSEFWVEDFEEDFKRLALSESKKSNRNRHSSSESESGQDERGANKGKGGKKSRKQRKKQQKGKRQLEFESTLSPESGDNVESPSSDGPKGKPIGNHGNVKPAQAVQPNLGKDVAEVNGKVNGHKSEVGDDKQKSNMDDVPLEYQDHRTKSEVAFQNDVMFELDD